MSGEHHEHLSRGAYSDFAIQNLEKSAYLKPYQIMFKQNGVQRRWDAMQAHDSVSVLIHDVERDVVILVKQFRPAVFIASLLHKQKVTDPRKLDFTNTNPEEGITYELCSGIVDKENKSMAEITQEEILEETGYEVPLNKIHEVNNFRAGIGIAGSQHYTYYAQVTKDMLATSGGGNAHEGEFIEKFELPVKDIKAFVKNRSIEKPPGLLYSLNWFLYEREEELKNSNYGK